jgi:N-acetylmuramoyl-L-alanine amidase
MLPAVYYFLQVTLCSALMMGYYWVVLRNKRFHQYNRFYLLAVAVLSWLIPLIKIRWERPELMGTQVIRFLTVVADNNAEMDAVVARQGYVWDSMQLLSALYFTVAALLLLSIFIALFRIYRLLKTASCKSLGDVYLIITQVKGTPFSFFRYIFWNEAIDLRSDAGKQILQHELAHVKQQHSADKLLIQLVLVAGWFNPFFWLLRREMSMIHEFIADQQAVGNGDTAALAQMLLTAAFPQQQFALTHPFFFSPIKRRLQMLTNHKNPRFSYLRRLVVLPLLALMVVLFAFRSKSAQHTNTISVASILERVVSDLKPGTQDTFTAKPDLQQANIKVTDIRIPAIELKKSYRIVINPGHGGDDKGAIAADGTRESDMALLLAKTIKEVNTSNQLDIVLTRSGDQYNTVVETASFTNSQSADVFVGLHMNSSQPVLKNGKSVMENPSRGAEIYIAARNKAVDYNANYALANHIGQELSGISDPFLGIKSREKGIYVLQEVKCPSVLIEAGFMSSKEDLALLKNSDYRKRLAYSIIRGIQGYLHQLESGKSTVFEAVSDTVITRPKGSAVTAVGKNKGDGSTVTVVDKFRNKYPRLEKVIILVDGERKTEQEMELLNPNNIESIKVSKTQAEGYGEEGKNGIIYIQTKPGTNQIKSGPGSENDNKIFTVTEAPPSFPGGLPAWQKYLARSSKPGVIKQNGGPKGLYKVHLSFIVGEDGSISNVKADNDPGYGAAAEAVRLIKNGPNWVAAKQNGIKVKAKHNLMITFYVS